MSEEIQPAPLRLKPRVRSPEPAATSASPATPAAVQATTPLVAAPNSSVSTTTAGDGPAPAGTLKLRSKPQLAAEPPTPASPAAASTPPVSISSSVSPLPSAPTSEPPAPNAANASTDVTGSTRPKPRFPAEPATGNATAPVAAAVAVAAVSTPAASAIAPASRPPESDTLVKLKPKLAAPPAPTAPANGVSFSNWRTPEAAKPKETGTTPPITSTAPFSKPPFPVLAPEGGPLPAKPGRLGRVGEKPEQRRAFKLGVTATLAAAGIALCLAGFLGWKYFSAEKTPARATAAVVETHPAAAPATVSTLPSSPAESAPAPKPEPSAAVTAATTIAASDSSQRVPALPQPEAVSPRVVPKPEPETRVASAPVATSVAPGVTANMGVAISNTGASPEFRAFVANVKISGVFQGANSRALINGRMTRVGDPIDSPLGVTFAGIDPEKKHIIFKDSTGAIATRRY